MMAGQPDAGEEWIEAEGADEFECVACQKSFRSEAAWANHERSKKHIKEVERLKREMWKEAELMGEKGDDGEEEVEEGDEGGVEEGSVPSRSRSPSPSIVSIDETVESLDPEPLSKVSREDAPDESEETMTTSEPKTKSKRRKGGIDSSRNHSPERLTKSELKASFLREQLEGDPSAPATLQSGLSDLDDSLSQTTSVAQPQLSKKDIRRAREAAKKAKQEAPKTSEEVCSRKRFNDPVD